MAEGGVKASRSAEELDKPADKPGKISHDLLNKFQSDPALTRPPSLPLPEHIRLSAQSFTSSSDEIATSHENLKAKKTSVRIKLPDKNEEHLSPSSADEDMHSDIEAGKEKTKKKRKLRWKWSPFKKMRKLFRRKKSPRRVKSCEELPKERYNPTYLSSDIEDNNSLTNRAKSEPSLMEAKTNMPIAAIEIHERKNTDFNPVQRTQSDPSRKAIGKLFQGLKTKQDKSQDDISEEPAMSSDERESQADSMNSVATGLDWNMINSDSGTEAAVSFENLPSASSLEGLQAAHDRIKVAPKHRRPPTRAKSNSSPRKLKPVKPHRRSKTDPQNLTVEPYVENTTNSDVVDATIFEALEISDEQNKEKIVADIKAKADNILANVRESPKVSSETINGAEEKEGELLNDGEKNKQDCVKECTTDNTNKENQAFESKQSLQHENAEVETNNEKNVLNSKKEECRPVLDMNRRSESLNIFVVKGQSGEVGHTTAAADKPQLRRRGFSLNSFESQEKTSDPILTKKMESEKLDETIGARKGESPSVQISDARVSQTESKDSTLNYLDENVPSGAIAGDKEESSGQPSWIELANKRSKRLSQLIDEGVKEDSQALSKVVTDVRSNPTPVTGNDDDKPMPSVKERPKVPTKPEQPAKPEVPIKPKVPATKPKVPVTKPKVPATKPVAAVGKPHPRSKTFSGTTEIKAPIAKSFSGENVNQGKKTVLAHLDKCVVCGTTVYQMERCTFDSSVLHRHCVKCTVCKRLLTVGNFVMAESKVYCKPHAKAVTVSM